jgi:hypothetical protein
MLDHIPDIASYFVYFRTRKSQAAPARAFVHLAFERLTDCSQAMIRPAAVTDALHCCQPDRIPAVIWQIGLSLARANFSNDDSPHLVNERILSLPPVVSR